MMCGIFKAHIFQTNATSHLFCMLHSMYVAQY